MIASECAPPSAVYGVEPSSVSAALITRSNEFRLRSQDNAGRLLNEASCLAGFERWRIANKQRTGRVRIRYLLDTRRGARTHARMVYE
ncbi:unnamed protein product, partial [Iphiclides podalirius]